MKCKNCGKPAYVNYHGVGGQKPYRAKLCVDCLRKNFAVIGVPPPMMPEDTARVGDAGEKPKGENHAE